MTSKSELSSPQPFDHLVRHARLSPSAIAMSAEHRDFTFAQLHQQAKGIAGILRDTGVQPGQIVVTQVKSNLHLVFMEALFHEAVIGCTFPGPVDQTNPVGFDWLVSHSYSPSFPRDRTIIVDDLFMMGASSQPNKLTARTYDDFSSVCRLIFSSGTTGIPVAIPRTIRDFEGRLKDDDATWMSMRPVLSLISIQGGIGVICAYSNMANGDKYLPPGTGATNLAQIKENYVATVIGSPIQLDDLVKEAERAGARLDDLTKVLSAGSYLPLQLVDRIKAITGATVLNAYGSNEIGIVAWQSDHTGDATDVGLIVSGIEVQIVDENDQEVPTGELGIIRCRQEFQAQSYFRSAEGREGGLRNGWFYPGDAGYVSANNHLHLAGRMSEMINSGGVKLNPAKVDAALQSTGQVKDVCTFAFQRRDGIIGFAVAVVPSPHFDMATFESAIERECRGVRANVVVQVASIARSETGKILRAEMANKLRAYLDLANDGDTSRE
jgi:acyl-CoA synthetase (AMP-forming)/AMP-acid ligase II